MNREKQVLLWSKFSPNCKNLLDTLRSYGVLMETICIDNEKIRHTIMIDTKLRITMVPTLLNMYSNGMVEKYEGQKASDYLLGALQAKPLMVNRNQPEEVQKVTAPPPPPVTNESSSLNDLEDKSELFSELSTGLSESNEVNSTDPSEIGSAALRDTIGIPDSGNAQENLPVRQKSGISSLAAKMQKEREGMDSKMPRPELGARR